LGKRSIFPPHTEENREFLSRKKESGENLEADQSVGYYSLKIAFDSYLLVFKWNIRGEK
jgi:hypothetical protein